MSAEYLETFRRNAEAILQAHLPQGWELTSVEAYEGRVVAKVEWADGHAMILDTHAETADDALADIASSLDKLSSQTWGRD